MTVRLLVILLLLWLARQVWSRLTQPEPPPKKVATMVACATCGSYIADNRAASALFDGKRRNFCDIACLERYAKGERLGRPQGSSDRSPTGS